MDFLVFSQEAKIMCHSSDSGLLICHDSRAIFFSVQQVQQWGVDFAKRIAAPWVELAEDLAEYVVVGV